MSSRLSVVVAILLVSCGCEYSRPGHRPDAGALPLATIDVTVVNDSGATRVFAVTAHPELGVRQDLMPAEEMRMSTVREVRHQQIRLPTVLRFSVVYTWDQSRILAEQSLTIHDGPEAVLCTATYTEPVTAPHVALSVDCRSR